MSQALRPHAAVVAATDSAAVAAVTRSAISAGLPPVDATASLYQVCCTDSVASDPFYFVFYFHLLTTPKDFVASKTCHV